jgi:hypothetical protein
MGVESDGELFWSVGLLSLRGNLLNKFAINKSKSRAFAFKSIKRE